LGTHQSECGQRTCRRLETGDPVSLYRKQAEGKKKRHTDSSKTPHMNNNKKQNITMALGATLIFLFKSSIGLKKTYF